MSLVQAWSAGGLSVLSETTADLTTWERSAGAC